MQFGWFDGARWCVENNGDYVDGGYGNDYETGPEEWRRYGTPTHWQPLPKPPEQ